MKMDSQPCSGRGAGERPAWQRGHARTGQRRQAGVGRPGAQSMCVLIAGAGHEDAEFVPPAITATVAASTSAAVLANGNPRSGRIGVTGFTEDQRSISVAFRTRPKAPE
jgi:hypothetical protein